MDLKEMLKKTGKGLLITAASIAAGATLGPFAAGAIGGFLSKAMGQVGVTVSEDICREIIEGRVGSTIDSLFELGSPKKMEDLAKELSAKTGVAEEQAMAALQFGLRELQNSLNGIVTELRGNSMLLAQVLQLANETGVKVDVLLSRSEMAQQALDEILQRLDAMERGLDMSFRQVIGDFSDPQRLDFNRLMTLSQLQRQRTIFASGFGIRYDPDLYVPRTQEESTFSKFIGDAGMTDRNIFLVLGNVGLGKTWFLARMSSQCIEAGHPTFFVPLLHGVKSLTSLFRVETIAALVDLIDPILTSAGQHAFIFLDGLDEMDPSNIRALFGSLAASRSSTVSFILSCRIADWTSNRVIVRGADEIKFFIYDSPRASAAARGLRVNTPVSVLMSEFTDAEMRAAMKKYGLPEQVPFDLLPLLSRPYIMRLSADWYRQVGSLPSPSSPEFLDLFAGGPEYTDSVFRRLGIITERDSLYATVEKLIEAQRESLQLFELPIDVESTTFTTLVSSGLLRLSIDKSGTFVSVNPEFFVPICALAILRHQGDIEKINSLLSSVARIAPDRFQTISKIVNEIVYPESMATPATETVSVPEQMPQEEPAVDTTQTQSVSQTDHTPPSSTQTVPGRVPEPSPTPTKKKSLRPYGAPATQQESAETVTPSTETPSTSSTTESVRPKKALSQSFRTTSTSTSTTSRAVTPVTPSSTAAAARHVEPGSKGLMFQMIHDEDFHVRRAAAICAGLLLSRMKDLNLTEEFLRPLLEDNDEEIRTAAAWSMMVATSALDARKRIELLGPLIDDQEWAIRRIASFGTCIATAKIPDAEEQQAVLRPLLDHNDGQVRSGAMEGLGFAAMSYADPTPAIKILEEHLNDMFDDVRGAAALGLGLVESTHAEYSKVIDVLTPLPVKGRGKVQVASIMALSLIGSMQADCSGIIRTVTGLLKSPDSDIRSSAALGLGLAAAGMPKPKDVVDLLAPLLKDPESDVRFSAALGTALVSTRMSEPAVILRPLVSHKNEHVRAGIALGHGVVASRLSNPTAYISVLSDLAKDREKEVRKAAIIGLGMAATRITNAEDRTQLLSQFMSDSDPIIRRGAALATGIAFKEIEVPIGLILGEVFWGKVPLTHDECVAIGLASSLALRYGH